MKTTKAKLTPKAQHLLECIARGQIRVFYFSDNPTGWIHLERNGLAVRNPDGSTASITDAGREWLAPEPVASAKPHGQNCKCPRCAVAHVRNGCRRINCPVCG